MFIYKITNTVTGKFYVGQTKRKLQVRLNSHFYEASKRKYNMLLHRSIRKHGIESFKIELLEECTKEDVYEKERFWIKTLNCIQPFGYNQHEGGKGGCLNPSEELRQKLREAKLGKPTWNKGLTKSDPRVAKNGLNVSKSVKGVPKSEQHKEAMRQAIRKPRKKKVVVSVSKYNHQNSC